MAVNNSYLNIKSITSAKVPYANESPDKKAKVGDQSSFESILKEKISQPEELKFSKHAELRLQSRNISLSHSQKERLAQAVTRAQNKGVKDSLVLMDNLAFVVSTKNRLVVTAVNSSDLKDNVFTNIDGAVIV